MGADGLNEKLGDRLGLGLADIDAEIDGLRLADEPAVEGEAEELTEALGDMEIDGLAPILGDADCEGLIEGDSEPLGEADCDGLALTLGDAEGL